MADVETILKNAPISQAIRASAWDQYQQASNEDDLAARLNKLPIPNNVKADLWDLKHSEAGTNAAPKATTTTPAPEKPRTFMDSASDFLSGFASQFDPRPALKTLYEGSEIKKAVDSYDQGNYADAAKHLALQTTPVGLSETVKPVVVGAVKSQLDQFRKAKTAYDEGRYSEAVGHTVAGALPLVGPAAAQAGETIGSGEYAKGAGQTAGLLLPFGLDYAKSLIKAPVRPVASTAERAAVDLADEAGVPLTAGQRAGSKVLQNVEGLIQNAPGGAGVAKAVKKVQSDALVRTGNRIAEEVNPIKTSMDTIPGPPVTAENAGDMLSGNLANKAGELRNDAGISGVTPEIAGTAASKALEDKIANLHDEASTAYSKLRDIENDPANLKTIQTGTTSARAKSAFDDLVNQSVESRLAGIRDVARSGATEMTGKLKRDYVNPDNPLDVGQITGRFGGGFKEMFPELRNFDESPSDIAAAIEKGGSNPLYQRLRKAMRGTVLEEEGDEIRMALRDAGLDEAAQHDRSVPVMKDIKLPVDMRSVKTALQPIYDRLKQVMPIAQQQASPGLKAIQNIMEGEDYVPASIADQNLSAIKSIARADNPNLRSVAQGTAAAAVKRLEYAVQAAVSQAGPEATAALKTGRAATKVKYAVADVLDQLRDEPVQTFNKLTAPKDSNIELLRSVAEHAPNQVKSLGHAYANQLMDAASNEGFKGSGTALNQWNALGAETKKLLFDPNTMRKLDDFFASTSRFKDILGSNPGQVFNRLTAPKDANIKLLRSAAQHAPDAMPEIGRAYVENLLTDLGNAIQDGRFQQGNYGQGLINKFNSLGPETQKILFKDPAVAERFESFLQLAKRVSENRNPSGTAYVGQLIAKDGALGLAIAGHPVAAAGMVLGTHALAQLLYSSSGAKLLMKALTTPKLNTALASSIALQLGKLVGDSASLEQTGKPALATAQ